MSKTCGSSIGGVDAMVWRLHYLYCILCTSVETGWSDSTKHIGGHERQDKVMIFIGEKQYI